MMMVEHMKVNGNKEFKMDLEYLQIKKGIKKKDFGVKEKLKNGFEFFFATP